MLRPPPVRCAVKVAGAVGNQSHHRVRSRLAHPRNVYTFTDPSYLGTGHNVKAIAVAIRVLPVIILVIDVTNLFAIMLLLGLRILPSLWIASTRTSDGRSW